MTMYGFVVLAWLIGGKLPPVPFATVDACKEASVTLHNDDRIYNFYCVETGATK